MASTKQVKARKKASALKAKRKKKKWFKVLSPEIYGKNELGEITAFEPNELLGRTMQLRMREAAPASRDMNQKVVLKITKVRGETAETEVIKSYLMDSSVQKKSRKIKEKIESVFKVKSGGGQDVKFKLLVNATKHVPRSTQSAIINALPELVESELKNKKNPADIFAPGYSTKLALELKKNLKQIYPVSNVYVWKVSLI